MKIHITCTEEFANSKLEDVTKILNKVAGEIIFRKNNVLTHSFISLNNSKFTNPESYFSLSFDELFNICNFHRIISNQNSQDQISPEDYVVLITSIRNDRNWFSAVNDKNIFIHSKSFETNTDRDDIFGVAYNILVNIFQSLLGLNYETLINSPVVHKESIGCINDFCKNKKNVILKLRTGYICDDCIENAIKSNVSPQLLIHLHEILQDIRLNFMNISKIKQKLTPKNIRIDINGDIYIGETNLQLPYIQKTLYYLYLSHPEGILTRSLCNIDSANEIYAIYKAFYPNAFNPNPIVNLCKPTSSSNSTYSRTKSALHSSIRKSLGNQISSFYEILDTRNIAEQPCCKIEVKNYELLIDKKFSDKLDEAKRIISKMPIKRI